MKKLTFILCLLLYSFSLNAEELTLRQLEKITLQKKGLHPAEILRWKRRARWSALLPRLSAGYDQKAGTQINNSIQDNISVTSAGINIGPPDESLKQDDNFNQGFEVKAYWNLNELIFNRDELAVSSEARSRTLVSAQILDELHQIYFERKKILNQNPEKFRKDFSPALQLRLEELEAKLDSFSDGAFSKSLETPSERPL